VRSGSRFSRLWHGITQSVDLPAVGKESELESVAKAIVAGEVKAVEAGFPAMANPSATEVATALASWS